MTKRDDYRALVYFRQSVIQRWLGKNHRARVCVRHRLPDAKFVGAIKKDDRAKYINLMLCKNLWTCPYCANIAATNRRNAIQRAIIGMAARDLEMVFVTYTVRHTSGMMLNDVIAAVNGAHADMHSGKGWVEIEGDYGWSGSIKICEITYGRNGWHFHLHEIGFIDEGQSINAVAAVLLRRWQTQLARRGYDADGIHGLDAKKADNGVRDYVSKWGIVPELASGADKKAKRGGMLPFQFPDLALSDPDRGSWAQGRFDEYARATKGTKQIWASPSVRPFMREQINDEKGGTFDESSLMRLGNDDWELIKIKGARALFLSYFEADRVDEFLDLLHNGDTIPKVRDDQ